MKRLLWVVVILCVACAPCAYADSFPTLNANITYVTASMAPNDGSGDNVHAITLIGPGTIIRGYGGMACFEWCSGPITDLNSAGTPHARGTGLAGLVGVIRRQRVIRRGNTN
jgi:hypothetical protein